MLKTKDQVSLFAVTDITANTSRKIIDDLLMLKCNTLKQLSNCRVIVSKSIVQIDHGKANLTLHNVKKHLETLNLECMKMTTSVPKILVRKDYI